MARHDQPYIGQYYNSEGKPRERVLTVEEYLAEHRAQYGQKSEGPQNEAADENTTEDPFAD